MENTSFTAQKGDVSYFPAGMGYEAEYQDSEIYVIHLFKKQYGMPPSQYRELG